MAPGVCDSAHTVDRRPVSIEGVRWPYVGRVRDGEQGADHRAHAGAGGLLLAFDSIKAGRVATSGSTGLVLERSLAGLRNLIDRSLADVRLDAGIDRAQRIEVPAFLEEVTLAAAIQAQARDQVLRVERVAPGVALSGDPQILVAALANLLQNAFKFTPPGGHISLTTRVTAARVMFDVEDECGGLPAGGTEELFRPFEQRGADRSGIGLGLAICRRAARASDGELVVKDLPGKGCVFTLDLPRAPSSMLVAV